MDTTARSLVAHIDSAVRALGGLFEGLLDISRLDAGVAEIEPKAFALQPIIERVCREYEVAAAR